MIAILRGKIIDVKEDYVIIDNFGIGYEVLMTENDLNSLKKGEEVELFIYTSYSMYEGIKLYGFRNQSNRRIFEIIKSEIPNTGNQKAMDYLNKIQKSVSQFYNAVEKKDEKMLKNIFGFTPKTAKKIIDFLHDKISLIGQDSGFKETSSLNGLVYENAVNALVNLGYRVSEAKAALGEVISENRDKNITLEDMIKYSLKKLSGR